MDSDKDLADIECLHKKDRLLKRVIKIRDEVCSGCSTFMIENDDKILFCAIPHKKDGKICPCSNCLLKSICEDECEKLANYVK